jgi:intracellular multiplication protein IcmJ
MKELILSATRASWQIPAHHGTEQDGAAAMKEVRPKVLARDDFTCIFCQFKAHKWQEVHHLDDDHGNLTLSNLVTACAFCHQCFHLGLAGSTAGGQLIWLPEMTQVELNHLARALFVAMRDDKSKVYAAASGLYMSLESRGVFMEQHFAAGASDPGILGQAFLKMKSEMYENRADFLRNIRLLPQRSRFEAQVKYWSEVVFRDLPPESWERLIQSGAEIAGE